MIDCKRLIFLFGDFINNGDFLSFLDKKTTSHFEFNNHPKMKNAT